MSYVKIGFPLRIRHLADRGRAERFTLQSIEGPCPERSSVCQSVDRRRFKRLALQSRMRLQGFTLIELMVTTAIMMVLIGFSVVNYNAFNEKQHVSEAASNFKSQIRLAQSKALSGQKPVSGCTAFIGYTVTFTSSTYTIEPECSEGKVYETERITVTLPKNVTFSPVPSSFFYKPLMQGTSLSADLLITLTNGSINAIMKITPSGDISNQ